ncbi:Endoglucanase A [Auxenochlorella protothecoides]|uniref:Endoglucanase n=1 Tax=Auxenochlorella protothecoides TaxID=3075 RepID=A0A087SEM9_AUXPR|nr:Endoglucanase A [Auxenochlorella protothecoides]KFM24183.1 Endoglucanase A [Auxenochlorella protothecoides]
MEDPSTRKEPTTPDEEPSSSAWTEGASSSPQKIPATQEVPTTTAKKSSASSPITDSALAASWLFYEAQVSGKKPSWNRIAYRGNSHVDDPVPGGWYDAGDFLKLNFPLGVSVSFLAWSVQEFPGAYAQAGATTPALNNVRLAATYLADCHTADYKYVGQIGDPGPDHAYWGRPEQQPGSRPAYIWTAATPASDLLGAVSAALSSTSLLFKTRDPAFAAKQLSHAKQLYAWGKKYPGKYNSAHSAATYVYSSSRYLDKLMYAAAWLFRATGEAAYAADAYAFWQSAGSGDIYTSWDSTFAPAINLLLKLASEGKTVPGRASYEAWMTSSFLSAWQTADGNWSIVKTPEGLVYPSWSQWGNLRYANNAGFMMALRASYSSIDRGKNLAWVQGQVDYALRTTGRSFVCGVGTGYPKQPHHRSASCPNMPAACGWDQFYSKAASPQALTGALVGGPPSGDGTYVDLRTDYVSNEVAVDYNAGYTGALAGLVALS